MAETAAHFLKQRKAALSGHMDSLQNAVDDLTGTHKLTNEEADCLVQLAGEQAIKFLKSQLTAWESLLHKDKNFMVSFCRKALIPLMADIHTVPLGTRVL